MEKGIKKAHPRATKLTDEPCYKRPIHGFCYTHFNMDKDKNTKLHLTVENVNYINTYFNEPIIEISDGKVRFVSEEAQNKLKANAIEMGHWK
ncbi:hypothetical protein BMS77_09985 [Leuconostoc pseudomesenteroides]|uniref:Uncharacterized protein n=1 Tax=Leuconostoc pseudomesenteroides TaxID=33968 RepID=A0A1X0VBS2_LEUPS|nr:hypothetical protein [Leuconostoc pseudomesenteroides]OQJ70055.1 hypothetical protein BMS77_09985 [Leuconostoc pseudomesenteroides]OQJ74530.1 hypothetical protein BMS83_09605 [Leuconostoc pseudomesenteroides]OQJ75602.1 hypothetical protein BMS82_09335 [Leuconostoc pseudomesenteroides]ORI35649.1 hypothetical protein BMR88_09430 [Leuconostoc pseudomesenteroides]ORI44023.1 hypothetical protein BMR94_09470 [Leuconostoc pseudomesenteroides]